MSSSCEAIPESSSGHTTGSVTFGPYHGLKDHQQELTGSSQPSLWEHKRVKGRINTEASTQCKVLNLQMNFVMAVGDGAASGQY